MINKFDKIYTVMVMTDLTINDKTEFPEFGSTYLAGWFSEFEDAYSSVTGNCCDINETCYDYALIEECKEGLCNPSSKKWLFKYDRKKIDTFRLENRRLCKNFVDLLLDRGETNEII